MYGAKFEVPIPVIMYLLEYGEVSPLNINRRFGRTWPPTHLLIFRELHNVTLKKTEPFIDGLRNSVMLIQKAIIQAEYPRFQCKSHY
jgi:hypothetical protein